MTTKVSTSYTDEAYAYANALVESGEFASVSAAVSAALIQHKQRREQEAALLEAEILRRAELPEDQWVSWSPGDLLSEFRARRAHEAI